MTTTTRQAAKFFNTAGPVEPERHYVLDPLHRWDLDEVLNLVDQAKYFILHAPRQTGKTSSLLALQRYLNAGSRYRCLYTNVEVGQAARNDIDACVAAVCETTLRRYEETFGVTLAEELALIRQSPANDRLNAMISLLSRLVPTKPLVLLIDEIDSLVGDSLISVLRQLRAGYDKRPKDFAQSVLLCGVRDIKDYRIQTSGKDIIAGGSAFNIKAESLRLGNFTKDDIVTLCSEHTLATGQVFDSHCWDLMWTYTEGQPWLVNALAYEVTWRLKANRDRSVVITPDMITQAKENLILRRETHLDQLTDKLREERVRRVIQPLLCSDSLPGHLATDDISYVEDLGLITTRGELRISNAIYREVIPRELTYTTQLTISQNPAWYLDTEGRLDMPKLLVSFQDFFRQHSEAWLQQFDYKEAGPQLLLQAFLQRIINGGGRVDREYGLGLKRTDLFVAFPYPGGVQRIVLELKLRYDSLEKTVAEALPQTWEYMDKCAADQGHILIFDRSGSRTWEEKIFRATRTFNGHAIEVWGM